MNMPPMLMHVKIKGPEHDFGIWLPLILFIFIAFIILLALSPLILLCILLAWPSGWGRWMWELLKAGRETVWSLRGLNVDIHGRDAIVNVTVI